MIPVAEDPRLERLSEICLGLPEAERTLSLPHAGFRVRRKTFAYYLDDHRGDEGIVGLACKAPPGDNTARAQEEPERFYIPAYVGPRGVDRVPARHAGRRLGRGGVARGEGVPDDGAEATGRTADV